MKTFRKNHKRVFKTRDAKRRAGFQNCKRRLFIESLELRQMLAGEIITVSYDTFSKKSDQKIPDLPSLFGKGAPTDPPPTLSSTVDFELFDGAVAPALPSGWTTTTTNANNWRTVSGGSDTAPNHAFVSDITTVSDNRLTTPIFAVSAANGRVSFRHSFDTEADFDGGILEISIAGGSFAEMSVAGGVFVSGGYVGTITPGTGSPIEGMQSWNGNSGGFITTVVDVPTSALGQNIQLRWRFGTDSSVGGVGWRVDTIRLSDMPSPPTLDFGDAPASYPVTLAEDGARHTVGPLRMGPLSDAEADGTHSTTATADGADEDGVVFQTGLDPGQTETIAVTASQAGGFLNAWMDFNADGDWSDVGEKVFSDIVLASGVNNLSVTVPAGATVGPSFARFRLSSATGLGVSGAAVDGEVEDYGVDIGLKRFVWVNRGLATDRFDETFGANAVLARGVVDAVFASWERVITNLNHVFFGGPGVINITVSMAATGTGFGASAGASFQNGFPTSGTVTVGRGNDTNGDGRGDGGGFFLDPTPMDFSEFQGDPTKGAFLGIATPGGPAVGRSDLFSLVNAEITHSLGLFSTPARLNNPINGTITNTGVIDRSEGGGVGTYYVFDGPSVTHLMTSNNGGSSGSSFSSAVHTAGRPGFNTNQPLAFNSAFRGARNLVGTDDPGNAVYSFGERTLVNDVLALIFKDAYNYGVTLPQTFGTTYALMNEATGNLIIRGGLSNSNDVINVSRENNEIVVSVNIGNDIAGTGPNGDDTDLPAFISRFPAVGISTITINGGDGNDSITVSPQVSASIVVNGGAHSTGDSLSFDHTGTNDANLVNNGNGSGTLTSSNRMSVTWSNIEVLTPLVNITSSNSVYNNSVYTATASLLGANTPAPALSFVYYSDVAGTNVISAPENAGTYFVRAFSAANAGNNAAQSAISQFQITPFALTASGSAANKVYDANTNATVSVTLGGVFSGDIVSGSASGSFDNKNIGNAKVVTIGSVTLSGADSGNYAVGAAGTTTANVTAKTLIGSITAANKAFDGTTAATITTRTLSGVIGSESVFYVGGTATFDTAAVGTGKVVTGTGLSLSGADAGNYSVNTMATTVADILGAATIQTRGLRYFGATGGGASGASTNLATDKTALLPGQNSSFANYTNYSRGLNGIVIDIANLPATTTVPQLLASLLFAQWNGIAASGFAALPVAAVPTITISNGAGAGGSSRVLITFPDNTLQNTWLRVTVVAGATTGLAANDVFYFGNVIGEVNAGNTATRLRVNSTDTGAVRSNQSTATNSAGVSNIYDINRDGRVNATDTGLVRSNQQTAGIVAPITAPSAAPSPSAPPAPGGLTGSAVPLPLESTTKTRATIETVPSDASRNAIEENTNAIEDSISVNSVLPRLAFQTRTVSLAESLIPISSGEEEVSERDRQQSLDQFFASLMSDLGRKERLDISR